MKNVFNRVYVNGKFGTRRFIITGDISREFADTRTARDMYPRKKEARIRERTNKAGKKKDRVMGKTNKSPKCTYVVARVSFSLSASELLTAISYENERPDRGRR